MAHQMEDTGRASARTGADSSALVHILRKALDLDEPRLKLLKRMAVEPDYCFAQTIQAEGSSEQQSLWLKLVQNDKIRGSYAETELGHEGFFQATETKAILDTNRDEFVISSPTLFSIKHYLTRLHPRATHTIIPARLYIGSRDHGVYLFIIPIRHPETMQTYPGVRISGEASRTGAEPTASTCIYFADARTPRSNLLMRTVNVTKEGQVKKSLAFNYPVRVMRVYQAGTGLNASLNLAKAVTIATRYAAVRAQGHGHYSEAPMEIPIIHQPIYYSSLLGLIAQSYASFLATKHCLGLGDMLHGNSTAQTAYVGALTSGLKAYVTDAASSGVASSQRTCGILGCSALSLFPGLLIQTNSFCVRHGENQRLYQETATYLMNILAASKRRHESNAAPDSVAWLFEIQNDKLQTPSTPQDYASIHSDLPSLLRLFQRRAVDLLVKIEADLLASTDQERRSLGRRGAWDKHVMGLIDATEAFLEAVILETFIRQTQSVSDGRPCDVLSKLCLLWGLNTILASPASFGAIVMGEAVQMDTIKKTVRRLGEDLLPDALALVDAWEFKEDEVGGSALGASDGDVYKRFVREIFRLSGGSEHGGSAKGEAVQSIEGKQVNETPKAKAKL